MQEIALTSKWYLHKVESVLKYETRKVHWDFKIQTYQLVKTNILDVVIINKKKKKN